LVVIHNEFIWNFNVERAESSFREEKTKNWFVKNKIEFE